LICAGPKRAAGAADFGRAEGTMKYLVPAITPRSPDWDFRHVRLHARDPALLDRWGKLANRQGDEPARLRARGGKLMITYGWADSILQPQMGVDYYEKAAAAEWARQHGFHAPLHGPGHGALRRRCRP
jgi:hypothetical protein